MKKITKLYDMCILFSLSLAPKHINKLLDKLDAGQLKLENCITVELKQKVPFIPNEEALKLYEKAVKDSYHNERLECISCKFTGYKYLHECDENSAAITLKDNDPTSEKECTCPNCGAEVEFGEERFEDTQAVITFKCPKCKTHGDKWYTLLYDRTVEYTVRSEQTAI